MACCCAVTCSAENNYNPPVCPGRVTYSYRDVNVFAPKGLLGRETIDVPAGLVSPVSVLVCSPGVDDGIAINGVRISFFGQPVNYGFTLDAGQSFEIAAVNDGGPVDVGATICFYGEENALP